jgi:ABC-2 type transport system permease protein
MKKIWIIIKTEFINTVTRRSFLLALILVPLIPGLILGAISLFGGDDAGETIGGLFQPSQDIVSAEGYVDHSNIITSLPEWIDPNSFVSFDHVEAAQQALLMGEINGYYDIASDYLETGRIDYVLEEFSTISAIDSTWRIEAVIRYNLLGADPQRFETYSNPVRVKYIDLEPNVEETDMSSPLAFYIPYGMTMLFYVLIMTSASLMLNSVAKEKENRVMEILMSSIKPNQLLAGKIIGLGLVGLLQMLIWTVSAFFLLRAGGRTFNFAENLQLGPEIIFWGVIFFVLGYLIYATLMAGIGAIVPNVKEATQATFYVIIPILIPLMLVGVIIEQPNATLPVVLSLIPLTAPNTIMTRLAVGQVPLWQLLVAMVLMIILIIFLIRGVAGMFRAQILLTGQKFNIRAYLAAIFKGAIKSNQ